MTATTRLYTTRRDAEQAVRDAICNVSTPASDRLVAAVAAQAWTAQQTPADAIAALHAAGEDCEGFEA